MADQSPNTKHHTLAIVLAVLGLVIAGWLVWQWPELNDPITVVGVLGAMVVPALMRGDDEED